MISTYHENYEKILRSVHPQMITYTEILQERLMQASCCEIFKARYADTD